MQSMFTFSSLTPSTISLKNLTLENKDNSNLSYRWQNRFGMNGTTSVMYRGLCWTPILLDQTQDQGKQTYNRSKATSFRCTVFYYLLYKSVCKKRARTSPFHVLTQLYNFKNSHIQISEFSPLHCFPSGSMQHQTTEDYMIFTQRKSAMKTNSRSIFALTVMRRKCFPEVFRQRQQCLFFREKNSQQTEADTD